MLHCRSQWPRGLRRRSAAARLLRSWVRIPPGAWTFICCECCVLSGRGLCDELITRPEESYRLWCVVVCDLETSRMKRPWPALGRSVTAKKNLLVKIQLRFLWGNKTCTHGKVEKGTDVSAHTLGHKSVNRKFWNSVRETRNGLVLMKNTVLVTNGRNRGNRFRGSFLKQGADSAECPGS